MNKKDGLEVHEYLTLFVNKQLPNCYNVPSGLWHTKEVRQPKYLLTVLHSQSKRPRLHGNTTHNRHTH